MLQKLRHFIVQILGWLLLDDDIGGPVFGFGGVGGAGGVAAGRGGVVVHFAVYLNDLIIVRTAADFLLILLEHCVVLEYIDL